MKSTAWYIRNPELFESVKNDIHKHFPIMIVYIRKNSVFIRGNLQLFDKGKAKIIDQFTIEIQLPDRYPDGIPNVKEINGRIPRVADRHIFDKNGALCLFYPDEKWIHYPDGSSISDFIKGPVTSFFIGQIYYELTGKFPAGERSHGIKGIIESYSELLQTNDEVVIKSFITYLSKRRAKGHWLCYCKSGKKLRHCHMEKLIDYRHKIKPYMAAKTLSYWTKDHVSKY